MFCTRPGTLPLVSRLHFVHLLQLHCSGLVCPDKKHKAAKFAAINSLTSPTSRLNSQSPFAYTTALSAAMQTYPDDDLLLALYHGEASR